MNELQRLETVACDALPSARKFANVTPRTKKSFKSNGNGLRSQSSREII